MGATLWGQTELSVFDDGQHGIWGMSYKYHERAIVFNEKNLLRMWDVAYDGATRALRPVLETVGLSQTYTHACRCAGYCGGKDCSILDWGSTEQVKRFTQADSHLNRPYDGPSIVVVSARAPRAPFVPRRPSAGE